MKRYSVNVHFYKEDSIHKKDGLSDKPIYSEYSTDIKEMIIETWESHINEVLRKHPDVAYIETISIEDIGIDPYQESNQYGNYYLCVNKSQIHGYGAFAKRDIKKGQIIVTLEGYIMNMSNEDEKYPSGEWNALGDEKFLVRDQRTIYGFINHSRLPNSKINMNSKMIIALCDIREGAEITIDYRDEELPLEYFLGYGGIYL